MMVGHDRSTRDIAGQRLARQVDDEAIAGSDKSPMTNRDAGEYQRCGPAAEMSAL